MAFNAGRVEVHLGAQLERRDFELYERKLKEVRAQVAKKDQFKAELGGDFNPKAFNAYQRELKASERAMHENVKAQGRLRTSFGALYGKGGAMFAAAGGIAAVTVGLKSVITASGEAEVSQRKLAAQLKAMGISYDAHAKEIDKVIQATSKLAGLDDEDLQDAFTAIVRATGSVSKGLEGTRIAADLARAKHMDVAAAGQLVGKVFSGNVGALKRLGIAFDPVTTASDKLSQSMKDQIRSLQKQAETAKGPARDALLEQIQHLQDSAKERTREAKETDKQTTGEKALAELRKRVSGQAEAYGKTQQGAFDRVNVAFENLRETIGKRLAPTITRGANAVAKFVDEMGTGTGAGGRFVEKLKDIGNTLKDIGGFIKDHIGLIKAAAVAWAGYKAAALGAAAASKVAAASAALGGGRGAAGGVGKGAAGAGAGGVAGLAVNPLLGLTVGGGAVVLTNVLDDMDRKSEDLNSALKVTRNYLSKLADDGDIRGVQRYRDSLAAVGRQAGLSAGQMKVLRAVVDDFAKQADHNFGGVGKVVDRAAAHFADFRKTGSNNMKGIRSATDDNMHFIRRTLGEDSRAGKEALAKNFRLARSAIRQAMQDGKVSVKEGLAEIQRLMRAELKQYGITGGVATSIIKHGDIKTEGQGPGASSSSGSGIPSNKRAGGGWIGAPGLVGGDIIPAMLAPGEAVLNRHQQAVIEGMLGDGFLDRLFETVDRPHYFAGGGRAGLMGAKPGLAPYAAFGSQFGLSVTSGLRPGSITSSGNVSLHSSGDAIDVNAGTPGGMLSYAKAMAQRYGSGLDELIHTPLGFGIKNGQRVAPYAVADHYDHVHVGDRSPGGAAGALLRAITAPQLGGGGSLRAIAQGALDATTRGANTVLERAVGSLGIPSGFGTGGGKLTGGQYGKSQLAALWKRAGGPENIASLMAAIALAESGGDPRAHNKSGASGLWQILGVPFPGNVYDPLTNARMAVAKYGSQGLGAWEAYTNGNYRSYLSRGGRARQFFARGGRAGSKRKKIAVDTLVPAGRISLPRLKAMQKDRIPLYDTILGNVDDYNTSYGIRERTYDLDTEELIKDDGSIDEGAIRERANELLGLISIRERIIDQLVSARNLARKIIKTYNTIIRRLRNSLKHAKKKDRSGIKGTINTYTERRDEWAGKLHELQASTLPSARLDLRELVRERGEVLGTKAEPADVTDTGAADLSGDTGADTSTDTVAAPASPADIAAAALADLSTFNQSRSELLGSYARNFISAFQAGSPGGVFSGSPDELSQASGTRFFGAGSTGSSLGGATIINNYNQIPDNTQTWSQQMRFQLEAA